MPSTIARRVSFSDRVHYSDDASASTVSTDDEVSIGDDSTEVFCNEAVEERNGKTDSKKEETLVAAAPEKEEHKEENPKDKSVSESDDSWTPLEDEPPLVFKDAGCAERPTQFLGGYGQEAYSSHRHRVKLRKSWVQNEEVNNDYNEFEEWLKSKNQSKKNHEANCTAMEDETLRETSCNFEPSRAMSMSPMNEVGLTDKKESEKGTETSHEATNKEDGMSEEAAKMKEPETEATGKNHNDTKASKDVQQNKSVLKREEDTTSEASGEIHGAIVSSTKASKKQAPHKAVTNRDKELQAHDKEILQLKDQIAKLQRKLDVIEVRTISELADLEEETTKRMRQYRDKASELARKNKAKQEKQALKEKAMKSHDLIEQLRRSNQKLRAEGIKVQNAVEKLRESNRLLKEKNSFHRDYASEFQNFQKTEIQLAKQMNQLLAKDMPKYEALISGMEDCVADRENSGHTERRAKELYEDCIQSMVAMMEDNCSDPSLVDRIASMMTEAQNEPGEDVSALNDETADKDHNASSSSNGKPKLRPSKRSSQAVLSNGESNSNRPSPVKTVRRSMSTGGRRGGSWYSADQEDHSSPRKTTFFRVARSPRSVLPSGKKFSKDDDSSTCSITSVQSDNFSLGGYAY